MLYKNFLEKIRAFNKIYALSFVLLFIFLLIGVSGITKALDVNSQVTWKTANVILVGNTPYAYEETNADHGDKARIYKSENDQCSDKLLVFVSEPTSLYLLKATHTAGSSTVSESCTYTWLNNNMYQSVMRNEKDSENKYIIYYWQDKKTIVRLSTGFDGTEIGSVTYTKDGKSKEFIENTSSKCKDSMIVNDAQNASYIARSDTQEDQVISWNPDGKKVHEKADKKNGGCYETKSVGIKLGYSENADKKAGDATVVPGGGNTGDGTGDDSAQESNCSQALSPFGWVLCPATNFADNLYSFFKQLVNNLLFFESDKYQDNGLYDSWKIMVTMANTVLVLVAIVMIAAQIFNFDFISAYTVKKALPRIVIAAILIQLSWFMVTTGIQIVNAIGSGMYWLLVSPFAAKIDAGDSNGVLEIGPILAKGYSGTDTGNTVGNAAVFAGSLAAMGALAVGAAVTGLWLSIIIAAIGVVISLFVAIITLVIREVLLIVLIAVAPIAIALWILPGTNNIWNMWWKTFSRLLMMYPLIMLLFAGGTIAAILLASAGGGINILFAIIAFFAPMFMIGATYKFAGGAFASIANMTGKLGDKAKGSGMFGLKDRAKFARENSSLSMARRSREADRQRGAQLDYANRMQGNGMYSRYLKHRSGTDERGRNRAAATAASTIAKDEQQEFAEHNELANMIIRSAGKNYVEQSDAREKILQTKIGDKVTINGQEHTVTRDIKDQVAVEALRNKEHDAVDYYITHDNGKTNLAQLATNSTEAFGVIDKFASDISRKSDIKPGSPSWETSLANFKDIGDTRRDIIGNELLNMSMSSDIRQKDLAITQISRLARDGTISADQLSKLSQTLGIANLSELRRNEQSRIEINTTTGRPEVITQ